MRIEGAELYKILLVICSGPTTPHETFSCSFPFMVSFIGSAVCSNVTDCFMPQTQRTRLTLHFFVYMHCLHTHLNGKVGTEVWPTSSAHTSTQKHVLVQAGLKRAW